MSDVNDRALGHCDIGPTCGNLEPDVHKDESNGPIDTEAALCNEQEFYIDFDFREAF